jgi:hypothetical protein
MVTLTELSQAQDALNLAVNDLVHTFVTDYPDVKLNSLNYDHQYSAEGQDTRKITSNVTSTIDQATVTRNT